MAMQLAVAYGAEVLETHITLDRTMKGSDQSASIEPQGLHELRKRIDLIEKMRGDGIKKVYDSEIPILEKLRR
jgi:N-acetylneuraminate synthase